MLSEFVIRYFQLLMDESADKVLFDLFLRLKSCTCCIFTVIIRFFPKCNTCISSISLDKLIQLNKFCMHIYISLLTHKWYHADKFRGAFTCSVFQTVFESETFDLSTSCVNSTIGMH